MGYMFDIKHSFSKLGRLNKDTLDPLHFKNIDISKEYSDFWGKMVIFHFPIFLGQGPYHFLTNTASAHQTSLCL
jgi:hypothetical protein